MRISTRRTIVFVAAVLAVVLVFSWPASAQQLLSRVRISNHMEDVTFVPSGPLANHVVWIDGWDVYGLPAGALNRGQAKQLFSLRKLPLVAVPRGIAWVESEKLFFLTDPYQIGTLVLTDHNGTPRGTRQIVFPGVYRPKHVEGLAYIPASATAYPDHIAMVAYDKSSGPTRIELIRRDGTVVADLTSPITTGLPTAIAYQTPGTLLVGYYPKTGVSPMGIWRYDLVLHTWTDCGQVTVPPYYFEGFVEGRKGTIVGVGAVEGAVRVFSSSLEPLPEYSRDLPLGLGAYVSAGAIAWNSDSNRYLMWNMVASEILSVDPAVTTSTLVAGASAAVGRMTYLAGEDLIAVARHVAQQILLVDSSGAVIQTIQLSNLIDSSGFPVTKAGMIRYLPATDQFLVIFQSHPRRVFALTRTGTIAREIDLRAAMAAATPRGFAYFDPADPSGGRLLVMLSTGEAIVTDLNGNELSRFNYRTALGIMAAWDVDVITSGPFQGAFAVLDRDGYEISVFTLR